MVAQTCVAERFTSEITPETRLFCAQYFTVSAVLLTGRSLGGGERDEEWHVGDVLDVLLDFENPDLRACVWFLLFGALIIWVCRLMKSLASKGRN